MSDNKSYVNLQAPKTPEKRGYSRKPLGVEDRRLRPRMRLEDQFEAYEARWAQLQAEMQVLLSTGDSTGARRLSSYMSQIVRTREAWRRRYASECRRLGVERL